MVAKTNPRFRSLNTRILNLSSKINGFAKRDFSDKQRQKLADSGAAMEDGSFPIANTSDLKNAIHAVGRAKNPEKVKAHIKSRAKSLGVTDMIPDDWK